MRKLNGAYAIEVLNGRLNGSSPQVEVSKSGYNNATFTKKIAGRSKISSPCQKHNMKGYMDIMFDLVMADRIKEGKQIKAFIDPFNNELDDIFAFMIADKVELTEEEFLALSENQKHLFKKSKNSYIANITKKRRSRLEMNALVNVSTGKVNWEWNVASSTTDSMPYQQEVYSGVHSSIFNLNISDIGKFVVSDNPAEYRDYSVEEAKLAGVRDLNNDERFQRVSNVLEALEYLSISSGQTNYLTDTKPKFIVLADYSWGNNAFQGILKDQGIDIDMLKESIEQNELHRVSDIYIGVNRFFNDTFTNMKEELENEFKDYSFVHISNVHNAFENYKKELRENLLKEDNQ